MARLSIEYSKAWLVTLWLMALRNGGDESFRVSLNDVIGNNGIVHNGATTVGVTGVDVIGDSIDGDAKADVVAQWLTAWRNGGGGSLRAG